jgi:mRNA interferase YafQ
MTRIERTTQFKRDYKRELKGRHRENLSTLLLEVLEVLVNNQQLEIKYKDHALTGEWSDHRDCHIKPDLVLIYRKPAADVLQLVRLGSHSQLGI